MPYRFVEDLTTADIAFEATGKTLEELFVSAANVLMNIQVHHKGARCRKTAL